MSYSLVKSPRTLNIVIFCIALLAILLRELEVSMSFTILKPLTTLLIIMIPILFGDRSHPQFFRSMVIGLVFCLLGDTLLLYESYFLLGLGAFLIGHLIFIYGFVSIAGFKLYWLPFIALAVMCCVVIYILGDLGSMKIPVIAYTVVISIMAWQGVSLYMWRQSMAFRLIALGSIMFVLSDSVLALSMFGGYDFGFSNVIIMVTYWLAVCLLANSTIYIPGSKPDFAH